MNEYLTAIEAMSVMFDPEMEPLQVFNKKTYKTNFDKLYQTKVPAFDAIESLYASVGEPEEMIGNMAQAMVDQAKGIVDGCKKRSRQDAKMMSLNMQLAVFLYPAILHYKGKSSKPLVDAISVKWKEAFPKSNVTPAEFEYIEKGFHRKFCYITTAVCTTFGKSDDCYELTLLRNYRDEFLSSQPGGEDLIRGYYDVAPSIVKHINAREDSGRIYREIWDEYLQPCVRMIEENRKEECCEHYIRMVEDLQERYFLQ